MEPNLVTQFVSNPEKKPITQTVQSPQEPKCEYHQTKKNCKLEFLLVLRHSHRRRYRHSTSPQHGGG